MPYPYPYNNLPLPPPIIRVRAPPPNRLLIIAYYFIASLLFPLPYICPVMDYSMAPPYSKGAPPFLLSLVALLSTPFGW